jgi:hypothetical protein
MTRRLLLALAIVVAGLAAFAGPAAAGGWAVTTLDSLPGAIEPGQATPIGYTIRQHGVTPVSMDDTALLVTLADGTTARFPGRPDGPKGHHVAAVTIPDAGRFVLQVDQGFFGLQDLGYVDAGAGSAGAVATTTTESGSSSDGWPVPIKVILAVATAGALVFLGLEVGSRRRRPVPV